MFFGKPSKFFFRINCYLKTTFYRDFFPFYLLKFNFDKSNTNDKNSLCNQKNAFTLGFNHIILYFCGYLEEQNSIRCWKYASHLMALLIKVVFIFVQPTLDSFIEHNTVLKLLTVKKYLQFFVKFSRKMIKIEILHCSKKTFSDFIAD